MIGYWRLPRADDSFAGCLDAWLRVMANSVHATSTKLSATGVNQGTKADILGLRLHGEW